MNHEELARRVVACPDWRWMRGMSAWRGVLGVRGGKGPIVVVTGVFDDGEPKGFDFHGRCVPATYVHKGEASYPDLTDPATVGCLLALVRDVVRDDRLHCRPEPGVWVVFSGEHSMGTADTEVELLVAVLERAQQYRALKRVNQAMHGGLRPRRPGEKGSL